MIPTTSKFLKVHILKTRTFSQHIFCLIILIRKLTLIQYHYPICSHIQILSVALRLSLKVTLSFLVHIQPRPLCYIQLSCLFSLSLFGAILPQYFLVFFLVLTLSTANSKQNGSQFRTNGFFVIIHFGRNTTEMWLSFIPHIKRHLLSMCLILGNLNFYYLLNFPLQYFNLLIMKFPIEYLTLKLCRYPKS